MFPSFNHIHISRKHPHKDVKQAAVLMGVSELETACVLSQAAWLIALDMLRHEDEMASGEPYVPCVDVLRRVSPDERMV